LEQIIEARSPDRPLWRRILDFPLVALLIGVVVFACIVAVGVLFQKNHPPMPKLEFTALFSGLNVVLCFAAYKLVLRHLGEHPRDDLRFRGAVKQLGFGLLIGAALFSAVVGVAALIGSYRIVACCSTKQILIVLFDAGIMAAVLEELLFRGILFRWIEDFGGSWAALVVTSALFGLAHLGNPGATWFSSFCIAMEAGVLLGGAYMLTRSLWMPIGLHAAWNFAEGYIFDVPVSGQPEQGLVTAKLSGPQLLSGGPFGLEASLIAVVLATAVGVWLIVLAVRRGEVVQPWWVRRRAAAAQSSS
jgi:membrane protease YdiL (CAAX protease family)